MNPGLGISLSISSHVTSPAGVLPAVTLWVSRGVKTLRPAKSRREHRRRGLFSRAYAYSSTASAIFLCPPSLPFAYDWALDS